MFTSPDWYVDRSVEDCDRVDWILYRLLNGYIKVKGLQIKRLNNGLSFDVTRVLAKSELIYLQFGGTPFRHPTFDWANLPPYDPMKEMDPTHMPMYGLYDPSAVKELLDAAERERSKVESSLDDELIENYVEDLVQPLQEAFQRNCGIYVSTDT